MFWKLKSSITRTSLRATYWEYLTVILGPFFVISKFPPVILTKEGIQKTNRRAEVIKSDQEQPRKTYRDWISWILAFVGMIRGGVRIIILNCAKNFLVLFFLASTLIFPGNARASLTEENEKISRTGTKKIERQIETHLQEEMGGADFKIHLDPSSTRQLASLTEKSTFILEEVSFNSETKIFKAKIVFTKNTRPTLVVRGRLSLLQKVAMPSRRIEKGELIYAKDIVWTNREETPLSRRAASEGDLLGFTPRYRTLEPGQVINKQDVQRPICVEQGNMVTVIYEKNGLKVVTLVKALDSGAIGDTIRVQNPESRKIFSVTVADKNEAKIILTTGR